MAVNIKDANSKDLRQAYDKYVSLQEQKNEILKLFTHYNAGYQEQIPESEFIEMITYEIGRRDLERVDNPDQ